MHGLIREQFFMIFTHFSFRFQITTVQINDSTNGDGNGRTPYDLFVLEEGQGHRTREVQEGKL
jgi:hypothetical protein